MTRISINRETISANYNRLRGFVRRTPMLQVDTAGFDCRASELHLKLECLQATGSFKARGAATHMLLGNPPPAGLVAASGGNHGAAVAWAAKRFGTTAHIFVPNIASKAKVALIERLGATLHIAGDAYADAFEAARAFESDSGAMSLHAYDQPETLVGQGSVGLETEAQAPGLTTLLVAVGGGGLIGGIAGWYQSRIKLIAVEPNTCNTLGAAMDAGEPVDVAVSGLAADSLGARRIGELAFPLCQSFVEDCVKVDDAAIRAAQKRLWDETRVVAEPGGATALAALISGAYAPADDERVGVIICGANTDTFPG